MKYVEALVPINAGKTPLLLDLVFGLFLLGWEIGEHLHLDPSLFKKSAQIAFPLLV